MNRDEAENLEYLAISTDLYIFIPLVYAQCVLDAYFL